MEIKRILWWDMEQKITKNKTVGYNLRRLREDAGLSQEKLCAKLQLRGCDLEWSIYAKYELGTLNVKVDILVELKDLYQCAYEDFFRGLQPHGEGSETV